MGKRRRGGGHRNGSSLWLKIRKQDNILTAYLSSDGRQWQQQRIGMEVSGYTHNMPGGFLSLLPGIYCCGTGSVTVSHFRYGRL